MQEKLSLQSVECTKISSDMRTVRLELQI